MRSAVFIALAIMAGSGHADGDEAAVERALIERDRQAAEFANPELRNLHEAQDQAHRPARPDERSAEQRERDAYVLRKPVPAAPPADYAPLPLPGRPRHGVEPVTPASVGG
jgi:hypothetical protein